MPFVAAPVIIPEAIRPILSKYAKSRTFSAHQVQRAKIILLAADGLDNMQISNQVGLGQNSFVCNSIISHFPEKWKALFKQVKLINCYAKQHHLVFVKNIKK